MKRRLVRLLPAYLLLLLVLAALGSWNQHRFERQLELMDHKDALRLEVVELRARAASVEGPLAVSRWAQEQGMVPAPEVEDMIHLMPSPAPELTRPEGGQEVRTVWR